MTSNLCRWGILGTAGIARKNWQAIRLAGNASLVAVASRSLERSRAFVAACQAACPHPREPDAVEGYGELLARSDVDAVYVPLPTGLRKAWVLEAAARGQARARREAGRRHGRGRPRDARRAATATAFSSWTA